MRHALIPMLALVASLCAALPAPAGLAPANVLVVYNSQNAVSQAVRDLYVSARPGVLELDLNSTQLGPGSISRADFVTLIRDPVRAFINGTGGGPDLSQQVIAIVTTRGLPARVLSPLGTADEFEISSAWASVESELVLLQQDLEMAETGILPFRYSGFIDNPYHRVFDQAIDTYSRAQITAPRTFTEFQTMSGQDLVGSWQIDGFTPGDMYLVCRLDSAPFDFNDPSALDAIAALLDRSQSLDVCVSQVQGLLDAFQLDPMEAGLDNGAFPPLIEGSDDFNNTTGVLGMLGVSATNDRTSNFVTAGELADQTRPLVALGSYGENHSAFSRGESPPGDGVYLYDYWFHPAAVFIGIESWNGTSLYTPTGFRITFQQQAAPLVNLGGSFTVVTVMEPFTIGIADLEMIVDNLFVRGLTFAEAAYSAIPCLSWQQVPLGDPLATVTLSDGEHFDRNVDNRIDAEDLYDYEVLPSDHDCDGDVDDDDRAALSAQVRRSEGL